MIKVLAQMEVVKCAAKHLHYEANGESFFGLHLLADRVDFGSSADGLKEAYYLGFKEEMPPLEAAIETIAIEGWSNYCSAISNKELVRGLYESLSQLALDVEDAKREAGLPAGVHAILDSISQTALVIKGLCWRTLEVGNANN